MMPNRYQGILRTGSQLLLELQPGNSVLRVELSLELKAALHGKQRPKVLEIGSGEGDLTQHILEHNPSLAIDILDVSPEMIERSKELLARYKGRMTFICDDALAYLKRTKIPTYDAIASAWVIHNFAWDEKHRVFRKIHSCLSPQGALLLMDKVYPDNVKSRWEMAEHQFRRYRYLDEPLRTEILDHEAQDASDSYRMDEKATLKALADAGFSQMHLIDRVERDVLIAAEK